MNKYFQDILKLRDISYLLTLQDFRNGIGQIFSDFFLKMTFFGEANTALVIIAVVYWAISKEFGVYLLMGWNGNRIVNGFLKVTACAYRPWIRDARIIPYGDSMTTATGYYIVSLIFVPMIKAGIEGPAGMTISWFLQMFYVVFLFPLCIKYLEKNGS